MELESYRNFLAIIEAGSFTGAAECVHVAQPALSKQLKTLENFFGAKLIITTRGSRQLILTEAGRILYQKAKYICSLEDLARNEIDNIIGGAVGTLRISAANSRSSLFISTSLSQVRLGSTGPAAPGVQLRCIQRLLMKFMREELPNRRNSF